jgi:glycerol uptake operon antiterminator
MDLKPIGRLLRAVDPVIASVKDNSGLRTALTSRTKVVFLLYGDVLTTPALVKTAKQAGRKVFVNLDMVDGLSQRPASLDFLHRTCAPDGILSTRANLCRTAHDFGMYGILRFFMVDSFAYRQLPDQLRLSRADAVEILPGCIPRVVRWIQREQTVPIICGGLVCDIADVQAARYAGADAVATSNSELWSLPTVGVPRKPPHLPPLTHPPATP